MSAAGEHLRVRSATSPGRTSGCASCSSSCRRRPPTTGRRSHDGWRGSRRPSTAGTVPSSRAPGAGCTRPRASSRPSPPSSTSGWTARWWHGFVAASTISAAPDGSALSADLHRAADAAAEATAALPRPPGRRAPARRRRHPGRGRRGALPARGAAGQRHRPRPGRGVRVRLVGVPPARREMRAEAEQILPGAVPVGGAGPPRRARPAIEGVDEVRVWLQELMDEADRGAGRHALRTRRAGPPVESMIAPPGSAAAPYYTRPVGGLLPPRPHLAADDGRDPLPGVRPGLAPGTTRASPATTCSSRSGRMSPDQLSRYQATIGSASAPTPRAGRCTRSG